MDPSLKDAFLQWTISFSHSGVRYTQVLLHYFKFFGVKVIIQTKSIYVMIITSHKPLPLQKSIGQQFKRETHYNKLPPIFRIKPPKEDIMTKPEGTGLCELFKPSNGDNS